VGKDLVEAKCAIAAGTIELGELTDYDARKVSQGTGTSKVRERPVDSIQVLADVLDEQDGALQIREPWRSDQTLQEAEIAASKRTFGRSTSKSDNAVLLGNQDARWSGEAAEYAKRLRPGEYAIKVPAAEFWHAGPRYRTVKGHQPVGALNRVEQS
jgi:hypothetical protein